MIQFGKPKRWEGDWPFPESQTVIGKNCIEPKPFEHVQREHIRKYTRLVRQIVKIQRFYLRCRSRRERQGFVTSATSPWRHKAKQLYEAIDRTLPSLTGGSKRMKTESISEGDPALDERSQRFLLDGIPSGTLSSPRGSAGEDSLSKSLSEIRFAPAVAMSKQRDLSSWLEAFDSEHRAGKYLSLYHRRWIRLDSNQDFFTWLDAGDGKKLNLPQCSRLDLEFNALVYCDASARQQYEADMIRCNIDGAPRLVLKYKIGGASVNSHPLWADAGESRRDLMPCSPKSGGSNTVGGCGGAMTEEAVDISEGRSGDGGASSGGEVASRLPEGEAETLKYVCQRNNCGHCNHDPQEGDCYLFLIDHKETLYVNKHIPGRFHFSSFLCGRTGKLAGEITIDHNGVARSITPATGRFKPTMKNLKDFMERFGSCVNIEKPKGWRGSWPTAEE